VVALSKVVPYIVDPNIAETMVAWHTTKFCCDLRIQHAILEGFSFEKLGALLEWVWPIDL
jgi:hypothetical protein